MQPHSATSPAHSHGAWLITLTAFVLTAYAAFAQSGRISLFAGGVPLGEGRPGAETHLFLLGQVAADARGGVLISERGRILRIDSSGIMRTIAGTQRLDYWGDGGPAVLARFDLRHIGGIAFDEQGAVYLADTGPSRIRKIDVNGIVTTVAGSGVWWELNGDGGSALNAAIPQPAGLVRTPDGTLFIAQPEYHRIRKVDTKGVITTFAGDGTPPSRDGTGELDNKRLNRPEYLALDRQGNLYVSDSNAHVIKKILPDGVVVVFAGTKQAGFSGDDGPATDAKICNPGALATDVEGNLYITDRCNARIRKVNTAGIIKTVAGRGGAVTADTGSALAAGLDYNICGLSVARDGTIYIAEGFASRVRAVDPQGQISLVAGASPLAGLDGPAAFARVDILPAMANGGDGSVFIVGRAGVIRKVDAAGRITRFAGNLMGGMPIADSPVSAEKADLGTIFRLRIDPQGRLLTLDFSGRILRIESDGMVSRIVGTGESGFAGDGGPALLARLNRAGDFAVDADGVIYIADTMNHRIRQVSLDGQISTIAGTGVGVSAGDNGPAVEASLVQPGGIAIDRNGDVLFSETHRVRRISKVNGKITKVIGDGTCEGEDLARDKICYPDALAVGLRGEIYVANGGMVARLSQNGAKDILTPSGWRPTQPANFLQTFANSTINFSLNSAGDLFFATWYDTKVWKVQGIGPFAATPSGLLFSYSLGAPPSRQSLLLETGDGNAKPYEITSSAPWLSVNLPSGTLSPGVPVNLLITADPKGLAKGSYSAKLTVRNPEDPAQRLEIAVSMTISGTPQQMRLSQTGFAFSAVQNGAVTSPRAMQVLNTGIGTMPWRATVQTLAGGNWLQVTPATGTSEAGRAAPEIRIAANPTGLAPGVYFGLVSVAATGVDNAPQSATIILNVTTQGQAPGPLIEPAGLLFTSSPQTPATPQEAQFANLTAGELTYSLSMAYPKDSPVWARITSANNGRVPAGGTARFEVTPNTAGLKAGVYTADLLVTVGAEKTPRTVSLVLVVASTSVAPKSARAADGCIATRLIPVFVSPVPASQTPAGWPASVSVRIVDDCAQPLTDGRVAVSFSTNDPTISLVSEGGDRWAGTWAARTVNAKVTLTAQARSLTPILAGSGRLEMGVRADATRPLIDPGGIRGLASQLEGRPVPMAGPVLILGSQLVPEADIAIISPLPTELKGTSALIAGKLLRLNSVAATRMEGVLPSGIPDSTPLQLIVKRGNTYSVPEPVIVTLAEPAIFTTSGTGVGQGRVYAVEEDGRRFLADSERPLKPGDRMALLCSGLGPVDRPLADGIPAPEEAPPQAVSLITVTVQNKEAEQVKAHLAPGLIGMYWVTATVPGGVTADVTADVVVKVGEQASPAVTAAILPPVVVIINP